MVPCIEYRYSFRELLYSIANFLLLFINILGTGMHFLHDRIQSRARKKLYFFILLLLYHAHGTRYYQAGVLLQMGVAHWWRTSRWVLDSICWTYDMWWCCRRSRCLRRRRSGPPPTTRGRRRGGGSSRTSRTARRRMSSYRQTEDTAGSSRSVSYIFNPQKLSSKQVLIFKIMNYTGIKEIKF